ncbi:MAG: NAD(P)H-hydrate epimerase, partial [archaeon]
VAEFVLKNFKTENKKVLVLCGTGNNGGDGFVAARHLKKAGVDIEMVVLGEQKTDLSREMFKLAEEVGVRFAVYTNPAAVGGFGADIIIDAIFGTGIIGEVEEPILSLIEWMNQNPATKISVDTPSGIDPDNGEARSVFVKADYTVCMHRVKKGLVGNESAGELRIVEIF